MQKKILKKLFCSLPKFIKYPLMRKMIQAPPTLDDDICFKLAETKDELESAFKLLHDCYVEVGLQKVNTAGMRVTIYHALPSTVTLIGKKGEEVVATLSIIKDNSIGLPSDKFANLLEFRSKANRVAEISALAIKKEYRGKLLLYLLKYMYEWCINHLDVQYVIAVLTSDYKSYELYESIFFFTPIDSVIEPNYSFSNFRPVIAECLDLKLAHSKFEKYYGGKSPDNLFNFFTNKKITNFIFPVMRYSLIEFPVITRENFEYFFRQKTQVFYDIPFKSQQILQWLYIDDKDFKFVEPRFMVSLKADYQDLQSAVKGIKVLDVSRHGMRLYSSEPMQLNAGNLSILIDKEVKSFLKIKVVWRKNDGVMGCLILRDDENYMAMLDYIESKFNSIKSGSFNNAA